MTPLKRNNFCFQILLFPWAVESNLEVGHSNCSDQPEYMTWQPAKVTHRPSADPKVTHRHRAQLHGLSVVKWVHSKQCILTKEWIKPSNSGSLISPRYGAWSAVLLMVLYSDACRSYCGCLPCSGTYLRAACFDYCSLMSLLVSFWLIHFMSLPCC